MTASMQSAIRWCGSLVLGLAIVYLLALGGLYAFGWFDEKTSGQRRTHAIELLGEIERVRLKDELGLDQRRARPAPPPPRPVAMPRQVSGFVQLEVEVGSAGEVLDVQVVGAVPEGYYEQQALEVVRARLFEPSPIGSYRQVEVIPFNITVEPSETNSEN